MAAAVEQQQYENPVAQEFQQEGRAEEEVEVRPTMQPIPHTEFRHFP